MRKDRPPANRGRIQDRTDRALIGRYEIRAFKSVAYEMLSAVARRQVPAEILRRITNMSELPVEQRGHPPVFDRSEEHTSELQSLMRISYAVFCLKKKNDKNTLN